MKPREFWIEIGVDPSDNAELYKRYCSTKVFLPITSVAEVIHLIEFSAFQAQEERIKALRVALKDECYCYGMKDTELYPCESCATLAKDDLARELILRGE